MSEGLPIVDFLRAFLYAFALRRAGGFLPLHLVILPLPLPVFRQALAADPVEYALVDVIIDRLFADLRFEGQPQPLSYSEAGGRKNAQTLNMDGSPKDRKGIERGLEAVRDCRPSARPQHNDIQGVETRTLPIVTYPAPLRNTPQ